MRKILFVFAAACLLLCTGCKKEGKTGAEKFNIDETEVTLTGLEGTMDIMIKSEGIKEWDVSPDADWLTVEDITARCLTISWTTNDTGSPRVAHVTITPGSLDPVVVTCNQPVYAAPQDGDLKAGDLTEDGKGIIYWVDESNRQIGKAVSLQRTTGLQYSPLSEEIGKSLVNGYANTAAMLAKPNPETSYPAAYWCSQLGEGWYLPAREELLGLFDIYNGVKHDKCTVAQPGAISADEKAARATFEGWLSAKGGEAMNDAADTDNGQSYISSTEYDADYLWYVRFGKYMLSNEARKNKDNRYTRCVKTIGNYVFGGEPVTLSLKPATLNFEGSADVADVVATVANGEIVSVTVDAEGASWCSTSLEGTTIHVSVMANDTGNQRVTSVFVSAVGPANLTDTLTKEIAVNQKPQGGFKVGDLYKVGETVVGVVFWTAEDAKTAKIVHLSRSETGLAWAETGSAAASEYIGASDAEDGSVNFAAMKSWVTSHPDDVIPAIAYCEGLGDGWYMPAKEEVKALFAAYNGTTFSGATAQQPGSISDAEKAARAAFDKLLTDNGGIALNTAGDAANGDQYITSTEVPESDGSTRPGQEVYSVRFGKVALNKDTAKNGASRYIRAVKKVTK